MINPGFKRIGNILQGLILSCCCFLGFYIAYSSSEKHLKDFEKISGIVTSKKVVARGSSNIKAPVNLEGFELTIGDVDQIFRYYNTSQNYILLDAHIKTGDTVTVYYEGKGRKLADTVQLEKTGVAIIEVNEFRTREYIAAYIAFVGGLFLIGLTVYLDSKHWN